MIVNISCLLFTHMVIISSFYSILSVNLIQNLVWLTFTFVNSSLILLTEGIEWLAAVLILIYASAIAILFIISLMTVNPSIVEESMSLSAVLKKPYLLQMVYFGIFIITIYSCYNLNFKKISLISNWSENIINKEEVEIIGNFLFTVEAIGLIIGLLVLLIPVIIVLVFVIKCFFSLIHQYYYWWVFYLFLVKN